MPAELTHPLEAALDAEGTPLRVVDRRTNAEYVLISADVFDRVQTLLADENDSPNDRVVAMLIQENMADDDANDPLLESYQTDRK